MDRAREDICRLLDEALDLGAKEAAAGVSLLELERAAAVRLFAIGRCLLAFIFACACRASMFADLRARGLSPDQIRLRNDEDGYATISTTLGSVLFPTFAYRDLSSLLAAVIRYPARAVFPFLRSCRSTPLCLEWEVRLGAQSPFRKAEELLRFFTRGASTVEDTTIGRHMLALSSMVKSTWLYRTPAEIRRVLLEQATRDKQTGRPLLYASSDAHCLRRFVGETWAKHWKNVNGIRIWCENAVTGEIIHLGGEFLWGDCHEVAARFTALIADGILPNTDDTWLAVNAQLTFVSDGAQWLVDHVLPLFLDVIVILDPYHLIDWFSKFAAEAFGTGKSGKKRSLALHEAVRNVLFEKAAKGIKAAAAKRRGHKKTRRTRNPHLHDRPWAHRGRPRTISGDQTATALLDVLANVKVTRRKQVKARDDLAERIAKNTVRIDYAAYLARGMQVGSGAMESLHRNGSQIRLKIPGAWLEASSQAVLRFRMLELSGRWDEFWNQSDLTSQIAAAFADAPRNQPQLEAL